MNPDKIGKLIIEQRSKKKMSQEDLAKILNINRTTVSKWERGKRIPDISILIPLSECLGISVTELLKGEKNINNEDIDSITVKAIKYSINKTKKKYISIALIIIICLTFFTLLGSYLYNYNKLTDHLINTCQNDTCVYGLILTNSRKNIIFIKNIEFNNEYVGTIDDIFTDTVTVSLISNNNVIMRYTTEHDQKVSLSEMLNNVYFYIDTSYEEYKNLNIDLANLTLTIKCNDINLTVDISI